VSNRKLKVLPENLINKIAAGEVVERPASVVKELVENSIDAGAKKITVEIKKAGKILIRVSDDGAGMNKEELALSLERHSTSKISQLDDLFAINTLGFRGEALPSIASISRINIFSHKKGENSGAKIVLEGGKQVIFEDFGCPQGTTVEVKDLFYNTPARKKFLKAEQTELFHITSFFTNIILSHPEIAFKLVAEGKIILASTGSGDLKDCLVSVFGAHIASNFIPIGLDGVAGYVSKPSVSRMDKKYQSFFVNGRYVKNFLLSRALQDALVNVIPKGRYPMAVMFIEVDPKNVDVNVHPTKREVKFANQGEVLARIKAAVEKIAGKSERAFASNEWSPAAAEVWQREIAEPAFDFKLGQEPPDETLPYIPLYQVDNTYIIAVGQKEFILIDQHAAHERILFDRLQIARAKKETFSQKLLIPENINLSKADSAVLEANLNYLNALGFEIEPFGKDTFALRSVPAVLAGAVAQEVIQDIISEYAAMGKSGSVAEREDRILKMLACKGAIKAGQKLSAEEMRTLIKDLFSSKQPHTCPHGRPTLIKYGIDDLEKMFKRRGF